MCGIDYTVLPHQTTTYIYSITYVVYKQHNAKISLDKIFEQCKTTTYWGLGLCRLYSDAVSIDDTCYITLC